MSNVTVKVSAIPHNPAGCPSPNCVVVLPPYRFLDTDEIKHRKERYEEIEEWSAFNGWLLFGSGSSLRQTYRTRLTREELARLT